MTPSYRLLIDSGGLDLLRIAMLLLALLSCNPLSAQSTPSKIPLQLGTISGGIESKTWKSDKATKAFPDMVREQISGDGPNRLDIELLQLTQKTSPGFPNAKTDSLSKIRYRVTTPAGEVIYDNIFQSAYRTGKKEDLTLSVDPVFAMGYGENLRRNIAQFASDYANDGKAPPPKLAEGSKPAAMTSTEIAAPAFPALLDRRKVQGKVPGGGGMTACYTIDTQPGEYWMVQFSQWDNVGADRMGIAADESCSEETQAFAFQNSGLVNNGSYGTFGSYALGFTAGGGPYVIFVRPSGKREYTTMATRVPEYRTKFPQLPKRAELIASFRQEQARAKQGHAYLAESSVKAVSTISSQARPTHKAGTALRDCSDGCPEMVVIRAGSFLMGSNSGEMDRGPNEGPQHRVTFARAFAVGKYEVTGEEWDACVAAKGCAGKPLGAGRTPAQVTWSDARAFAAWLTEKTGQAYELLSEAEWEYAARAGTDTPWNTGDAILTDDANIMEQFKQLVKVGGFPPNAFYLHDMHGNSGEWVLDCIDVGYFGVPSDGGAAVTPNCPARVWRGGNFASMPQDVRSAWRGSAKPDARTGFRVGRAL